MNQSGLYYLAAWIDETGFTFAFNLLGEVTCNLIGSPTMSSRIRGACQQPANRAMTQGK